jgi:CRP-like cAMP-binding protein
LGRCYTAPRCGCSVLDRRSSVFTATLYLNQGASDQAASTDIRGPSRRTVWTTHKSSIVLPLEHGGTIEVGTVGGEGMLPIAPVLGGTVASSEAIVQLEGSALRMPADILRQRLNANEALRRPFHRYAHSFHQQVSQTAACNGAHSLEQRCARWLLLARHRIDSDDLPLTQEFLSMMLAVRRSGVTTAAGALQQAGLIRYRHGHITVLDPAGLEEVSCECFGRIAAQEAQLLA